MRRLSLSVVCRNIFSSQTAWQISQISYGADSGMGCRKFVPGHMTKLAAMSIYGKNLKNLDLETWNETIVVHDIKVGRCSHQLNEYMNLYEYQRPRSFIDLGPMSFRFKNNSRLLVLRNRSAD